MTSARRAGTGSMGTDGGRRAKHMPRDFSIVSTVDRILKERDDAVAKLEGLRRYIAEYPGGLIGKKQLYDAIESLTSDGAR